MVKPFDAIPQVTVPADYPMHVGEIQAAFYEKYGPIYRRLDNGNMIVYLVGPEANRFVLSSNRLKFSHKIGWGHTMGVIDMFGDGLLTMDGATHAEHRRMMNPAFAISYMDRYIPIMNRIIKEQMADWITQKTVDIYDEARKITFRVAAETLFGLKSIPEIIKLRDLFLSMMRIEAATPEHWIEQLSTHRAQLYNLLLPKIEERRQNPADDVLGMLVRARDDQGRALSDEQLFAHTNILLVAGHETSTSLSAWLLYLLSENPDYEQRVLAEQAEILNGGEDPTLDMVKRMKVLDNALSEAERLYPPVPNGPRGVIEDFEFNDYHVPAGTFVFYGIAASHRLPSLFANPDAFDPDRFAAPREEDKKVPYSLVGFGGGPRICLGLNFAQVEIKLMISHILRHYQLKTASGQTIVQWYGATGAPMNGINMQVSSRA